MTDFKLDTSGRVECPASFQPIGYCIWSDLDPFTQGYIEALFASIRPAYYRIRPGVKPYGGKRLVVMYRAFEPDGGPLREVTGYVEVSARKVATAQRLYRADELEQIRGFSDLAPETLARIMEDCAAYCRTDAPDTAHFRVVGEDLWRQRQNGKLAAFPPLTVYLADDGKVRFQE